jgi:hypothetical protein
MYLISVESDFSTLKFIDPAEIVSNAPVLRAQNMKKLIPLNGTHKNDFFNDLLHPQQPKKTKNDYSDSDSDF